MLDHPPPWRRLAAGAGALALFGAGLAFAAADSIVTLTANGPQPPTATVNWGDTVVFTNIDQAAHVLASTEPEIGTTTVAAGQSATLVFAGKVGTKHYVFSASPRSFYGPSVVVQLRGSIDLAARTPVVTYGASAQLDGRLTLRPGAEVTIVARHLNIYGNGTGEWTPVAGPLATTGHGAFSYGTMPRAGAEYAAHAAAGQLLSKPVTVLVSPSIRVRAPRRVRAGRPFTISVRVAPAAVTRTATLETYVAATKTWHSAGKLRIVGGAGSTARSVQSGTSRFRVSIASRDLVAGFTAGTSKSFTVVTTH